MKKFIFIITILSYLGICNLLAQKSSVLPNIENELVPFSINWESSKDSKLNLSFLLDKPAGKNGFISIKDGHFVKPTGERFKMWGVNIVEGACFPDKKDAPAYAAFLARFGINTVRLHIMDRNSSQNCSLFNYKLNNTRELYPDQLDKLDFFISELKKAGIYSDLNLNNYRIFRKDDGVPEYQFLNYGKGATLFDDHLIELQKEYAKQLLTHINPYTGNAYINEPAIVMVEIVNENSLIDEWIDGRLLGKNTTISDDAWIDLPPYYGKELTTKFNSWLKKNVNISEIKKIKKEVGVKAGEDLPRLAPKEFKNASELRFHTEAKFIIQTERDFHTGMYNYLKKELLVKSLVIGNSDNAHNHNSYAFLSSASLLDIVDSHVYWQHPDSREISKPMVNDPKFSTVVQLSRSAVEGKPFTVSETNHPFPNEYACEGIPILGAYGSLQDWDGIFIYALEHVSPDLWNNNYSGSFSMGLDPIKMPSMAAIGLMFLRGDLNPAESCVQRGYTRSEIIEGIRETSDHKPFFTKGFSPLIPLIEKTRISSFDSRINNFPIIKNPSEIKSNTGEIDWHVNDKSFVEVAAPKTESLTGFIPAATSLLKHMNVNVQNKFASITLISLDDKPIETSEKLLLLTIGRTGMTGMKWSDDRKNLVNPGAKPTTIEVIKGEIILSGLSNAKEIVVEPLDGKGNSIKSMTLPVDKGVARLEIGNDITVWYYLDVKR